MNKKAAIKAAEDAYLKKILGFEYEEVKTTDEYDGEMNLIKSKKETVRKFSPPDVGAVLDWLRDNCPERWSASQAKEDEYSGVIILPEVDELE